MVKVKLSTLAKDEIVCVENSNYVNTVEDILNDLSYYRDKKIYISIPHYANFDAKEIIDDAIEFLQCNGMYEDWDDKIHNDITEEDIKDIQAVFDRILERNPSQNISYEEDREVEIDL